MTCRTDPRSLPPTAFLSVQTRRIAFTLIELLIVVVIIGILAAIAIPKFSNTKGRAYIASMKSDLRNLASAMEGYFNDNASTYATTTTDLNTGFRSSTGVTVVLGAVTRTSWSATATHTASPKTCTITLGGTGSSDSAPICP